jgi:Ion channel
MATRSTPSDPVPEEEAAAPAGRFGLLLVFLICAYLLSAFVAGRWVTLVQVLLFNGIVLLALRNLRVTGYPARLAAVVVLVGSAVIITLLYTIHDGTGIAGIWTGLILLAAAGLIVQRVFIFATVTAQSIYGVVSAYLIVGLMFSAFFSALDQLGGGPFFANGQHATAQTLQYFSFTTLTTLGYGDFTAAGNVARAVAVLEALAGQIFLATLVARLVAQFRTPRERQH